MGGWDSVGVGLGGEGVGLNDREAGCDAVFDIVGGDGVV